MDKRRIHDELAHPDYWDARYEASICGRPASTTFSNTDDEEAKTKTKPESERQGDLDTYDWFRTWEHLESWFKDNLPSHTAHPRILHLGCGNSTLTADLHEMGFTNQTSIDFSSVVIRGMAAKYKRLGVEWKVMDVRDMSFDDKTFDIAIDKGTMDSMFHGSMWDPPDDVRNNITKYLDEIERILVPGGTFLYLTYRQPHFIRPLLMRDETWSFDVRHLPDKQGGVFEYFAYVMVKHGQKQNGVSSSVSNSEDEES